MKVGDRVRYIGHTTKCKSCVLAGKPKPQRRQVVAVAGALDDKDEFDSDAPTNLWDYRLLEFGTITDVVGIEYDTIWIKMDNEDGNCNAYASHLEVIS